MNSSGPDDAEPPDGAEADAAAVRAIVLEVRAGNREAFGRLVERFQRRLFGLVMTVVRDPEGAEEVTQDAFVRAFTRLDHYDAQRPFYPWLATIGVRLGQNWLRGRGRPEARTVALIDANGQSAATADPLARLLKEERHRHLWRAVEALSSGERTVVALHYRQELSVAEVAAALGVTRGTVKTLLFRAREKLRASHARAEARDRSEANNPSAMESSS